MKNRSGKVGLDQLKRLAVEHAWAETACGDLTRMCAHGFDLPITIVSLFEDGHDLFEACVGLPLTRSPVSNSLSEVFFETNDAILVVEDTTIDDRFSRHPSVVGPPFIRFYAAARLVVKGNFIGAMCACDTKTKQVAPEKVANLQTMALAALNTLCNHRQIRLPVPHDSSNL